MNPRSQSTEKRIEQLNGKRALVEEWEAQPIEVQVRNKTYISRLRKKVQQVRNYIVHRKDTESEV